MPHHAAICARFALLVAALCLPAQAPAAPPAHSGAGAEAQPFTPRSVAWAHLSSKDGNLPVSGPQEQTAALVLDIDKDGVNDFVIGGRGLPPALSWFRRGADGWSRYVIEPEALPIEAGGAFADVDRDGDLDLVMGGDYTSNQIWWWANPYPNYTPETAWPRYLIKRGGATMHHDALVGDFDGDGGEELAVWNQGARQLLLAAIPANPTTAEPWPFTPIFTSRDKAEGLAKADIDGDGILDIVGGGRWFKHAGGTRFTANLIDDEQIYGRAAVGQLKPGGRPEVVFVPGDEVGRLKWYEWNGNAWVGRDLLGADVDRGHSLELADLNADGHLDIFCAEMRLNGGNPDAKAWIFYGDGQGGFTKTEQAASYGNHESRVADLDGDGDLDILGKPYNWETPRLDIWLNTTPRLNALPLNRWERHVIDAERPGQAIFIGADDLDGDGRVDIAAGGVWYRNPGDLGEPWERRTVGAPLANMAAIADFDGDGNRDILGTKGEGASANPNFVWAQNDGAGGFTVRDNIPRADGDFLQGVAVGRLTSGGPLEVALSWHQSGRGVQLLTVPADPVGSSWGWRRLAPTSQDEALSLGDIDRDGDPDLLLGTRWLRNDGAGWSAQTLNGAAGLPDRNRLVDVNGDGRLDAVVGFEAINLPGKLAWYEQGEDPAGTWTERVIATVIGPMSVDALDMDGDGDVDVVVGEHNLAFPSRARLYVFENADGAGRAWVQHLVHIGDEHHDGAQLVDIDRDGDNDIISIGWGHRRVLLYENKAIEQGLGEPSPAPVAIMVFLPKVTAP